MNEERTTVTLLPRGDDMVEVLHDGVILARAWENGTRWSTGKMHALKGMHDIQTHKCRSDALGRLVTLAMLKQHATT